MFSAQSFFLLLAFPVVNIKSILLFVGPEQTHKGCQSQSASDRLSINIWKSTENITEKKELYSSFLYKFIACLELKCPGAWRHFENENENTGVYLRGLRMCHFLL